MHQTTVCEWRTVKLFTSEELSVRWKVRKGVSSFDRPGPQLFPVPG